MPSSGNGRPIPPASHKGKPEWDKEPGPGLSPLDSRGQWEFTAAHGRSLSGGSFSL